MNLKTETALYSRNLVLRDATEEDSEFIIGLRTNPKKARFLSVTSPSIDDQKAWMKAYQNKTNQAYFIIEDKNSIKLGCIRIYNPLADSFEWGSWLIIDGAGPFVALESALAIYSYARRLGFSKVKIDVRKENISVWRFHERIFGAVLVNENDIDRFYEVSAEVIDHKLEKYRKLLIT
jgi:RimJ/RimL family protein N-acetyltransferase